MDVDESFVSISLETNECDICQEDTGEALTTCQFCVDQLTEQRVKEGFNQIIHIDTHAHKMCFDQSHRILQEMEPSPTLLRKPVESISPEHIRNVINGKIQWLINYAKNVSSDENEEKLQITCNDKLQVRSSPCSRTASPRPSPESSPKPESRRYSHDASCISGNHTNKSNNCSHDNKIDNVRHSNKNDNDCHGNKCGTGNKSSIDAETLKNSYRQYLFGGKTPKQWNENKENKQSTLKVCKSVGDFSKLQRSALTPGNSCHGNRQLYNSRSRTSLDQLKDQKSDVIKDNGITDKNWNNSDNIDIGVSECEDEVMMVTTESHSEDDALQVKGHNDGSAKTVCGHHQAFTSDQLTNYSITDLQRIVRELAVKAEGMSTHLVNILQEKDALNHQISVRHATIAKLVKMKQQKIQVKQTSVLA